jgi:hypothetical protein
MITSNQKIIIRDAAVLRQQRRSTEGCRHRANRGKGGRTWEDRWEKPWFFQWEKFFISFKSLLTGPLNGPLLKVAILSKKPRKPIIDGSQLKKTTETTNQRVGLKSLCSFHVKSSGDQMFKKNTDPVCHPVCQSKPLSRTKTPKKTQTKVMNK